MTKLLELLLVMVMFAVIATNKSEKVIEKNHEPIVCESINVPLKPIVGELIIYTISNVVVTNMFIENKSFDEFLEKLAWRESRGDWKVVNRFGYMGKYQIGKLALKDIGMDSITASEFKKDPNIFPEHLQDVAIRKYILKNKKYLKNCIECYKNRVINGIVITESSIIGAAHLVGHKNVKEWLSSDGKVKKVDGNGVTIESYLKLFSGYKMS